jgi:hypothetical protein
VRAAWVIILLAVLGAGLAKVRTRQIAAQAQMARMEAARLKVRRRLWDQQLRLGRLRRPKSIEYRCLDWALELRPPGAPGTEELVRRDR